MTDRLYLKHRLAVSSFAPKVEALRQATGRWRMLRNPELGLISSEDRMIDDLLPRFVKRDAHCLDVGGHIGSVSHKMRTLAPDGRLTIVEASPRKAGWLKKAFPDATVAATAVSDEAGEVTFYESVDQPGFSSLGRDNAISDMKALTVPCTTLDTLLPEGTRLDFMKIDIEGFEHPALMGGDRLIREARPVILFEAGPHQRSAASASPSEALFSYFADRDYRVFSPFQICHNRGPHDLASFIACRTYPFLSFNFFALPSDHVVARDLSGPDPQPGSQPSSKPGSADPGAA